MFNFRFQDHYEPAIDAGEDRDLIAAFNEARSAADVQRITTMARHRVRARNRQAAAAVRPRRASAHSPRFSLGRALSFRH